MSMLLCALACLPEAAAQSKGIADSMEVLHHSIWMDLTDFEGQQIKGKAALQVRSKVKGNRNMALNLLQLEVDTVWVDGKQLPQQNWKYDGAQVRIDLKKKMKRNGKGNSVTIAYHGKPQGRRFGGFTWFPEQKMAHNMGVSINDVPHSYAKAWYPAVDEFTAKSTYDFTYIVPDGMTAVGNGTLVSFTDLPGPTSEWKWSLAQKVPDYLVNVAVGSYKNLHYEYANAARRIPIDIYVTEDEYEGAQKTFDIIPAVMRSLESRFGPYAFDRVGYVTVNTTGGAMEHVTNISMPRRPQPTYDYREMAIHELIHSWFGNLVTCENAGDMWLNEGMTSYVVEVVLEDLISEGLLPEEELPAYQKSVDRAVQRIPKDSPRYHALAGMPESDTYGTLVYQKGAWVMRQLRAHLGDQAFFKGMREYVDKFAFGNATTLDFKKSMEKSTGVNLDGFFDEHIYN